MLPKFTDQQEYPFELLEASNEPIVIDTETAGETKSSNIPIYFSWAANDIPAGAGPTLTPKGFDFLRALVTCKRPKICHNIKFDFRVLSDFGTPLQGELHDTIQMCHCLYPYRAEYGLEVLGEEYLPNDANKKRKKQALIEAKSKINPESGLHNLHADQRTMYEYALGDAADTLGLFNLWIKHIIDGGYWRTYQNKVEAEVAYLDVERRGLGFNSQEAKTAIVTLNETLKPLAEEIYEIYGERFLVTSSAQLAPQLKKFFPLTKLTKGRKDDHGNIIPGSKRYCTDKDTLEPFKHDPRMVPIVAYKFLAKAASTLAKHLERESSTEWGSAGRLYSEYRQTTATGRSACRGTPLQQVPKNRGKITEREVGDVELAVECARAFQTTRRVFIAGVGTFLVSFDLDQGEYRACAHYSGSERLINIFKRDVGDFHEETCKLVFGAYDKTLRNIIKVINFGLLYGMGPPLLAIRIKPFCSYDPKEVLVRYERELPEMREFQANVEKVARARGGVRDVFGQFYPTPYEKNPWTGKWGPVPYKLVSYLCQGTVAQIKKFALVRVQGRQGILQGKQSGVVADIHDELVIETHPSEAHLLPAVHAAMTNFPEFRVPFTSGPAVGRNLLDMQDVGLDELVHIVSKG